MLGRDQQKCVALCSVACGRDQSLGSGCSLVCFDWADRQVNCLLTSCLSWKNCSCEEGRRKSARCHVTGVSAALKKGGVGTRCGGGGRDGVMWSRAPAFKLTVLRHSALSVRRESEMSHVRLGSRLPTSCRCDNNSRQQDRLSRLQGYISGQQLVMWYTRTHKVMWCPMIRSSIRWVSKQFNHIFKNSGCLNRMESRKQS